MHVYSCRDCEDIVQFLERALFCFWDPEKDHAECYYVQTGVECECALNERVSWMCARAELGVGILELRQAYDYAECIKHPG